MNTSGSGVLNAAFLQSWNAIVITDADLDVVYRVVAANPAFCTMTGYTLDVLHGGPTGAD